MKKLFFLPILGMMLFACSKQELVQVNGTVHGYVQDNSTGGFLSGVTVTYRQGSDSGSVVTDATGYYSITGLDAGYVPMTFSLSGYATITYNAWIEPLYDYTVTKGGGDVPYYDEVDIHLPVMGSTINGVLMKEIGPYNNERPAANYRVICAFQNDMIPEMAETTTNSRGEFTIANVPCDMQVYLYFEPSIDDDNLYESSSRYVHTPYMGTVEIRETLDRTDLGIYLVSTNLWAANGTFVKDFPVDEPIVLNFNQTVSQELTERDGYISLSGMVLDPTTDITYSGSTITITPPIDLANDADYTFSFSVSSETVGDTYSLSIGFHTEE